MRRRLLGNRRKTNQSDVVTDNLMASYQYENDGLQVFDSYIHELHGGLTATAETSQQGIVGKCWRFINARAVVFDKPKLRLRDEIKNSNLSIAFSFWVKFDVVTGDYCFFSKRTLSVFEYQLSFLGGNFRFSIGNTDGTLLQLRVDGKTFTPGVWIHLSGYIDVENQTGKLFQNNVDLLPIVAGEIKTILTSDSSFVMGNGWETGNYPLKGYLDEFRIWIGETVPTDFNNEYNNGNGITL